MRAGSKAFYRWTKPVVFVLCLLPLVVLVLQAFAVAGLSLGANPIEKLLHELGRWGLKFLLITLTVTPLRRWTGWVWLISFRRMLGLFAFFYTMLHFLCYAILDQGLNVAAIVEDIVKRPYITLGMLGLLLLIPLAVTSTKGMMRRLGRRWQSLHRLVYVIAIAGVWHFYWQEKLDTLDAAIYAAILAFLLAVRIYYARFAPGKKQRRTGR
ncbi:MAG: sulfoxide reductase heme-binding subunit YedZ [Gammaproteobacteria bacterium]|nr:sulfoxide reductase heme-binding subunit YedZ [Gammaproteobacteria bacterium]MBT8076662.1 sulfoxide reductase heme-binding subunit YedZ [Gammaproteobacteria bacterium]NNK99783.1 sulfoxide reductase heme-binding subunit YedZ [Xanthomonadales bacterium]